LTNVQISPSTKAAGFAYVEVFQSIAAQTDSAHWMALKISCCVSVGGSATVMGILAANRL
jgi:hypothetical protein